MEMPGMPGMPGLLRTQPTAAGRPLEVGRPSDAVNLPRARLRKRPAKRVILKPTARQGSFPSPSSLCSPLPLPASYDWARRRFTAIATHHSRYLTLYIITLVPYTRPRRKIISEKKKKKKSKSTCRESMPSIPLSLLRSLRPPPPPLRITDAAWPRSSPSATTTLRASRLVSFAHPSATCLRAETNPETAHSYTFDDGPYIWNTELVNKFNSVNSHTTFCSFHFAPCCHTGKMNAETVPQSSMGTIGVASTPRTTSKPCVTRMRKAIRLPVRTSSCKTSP
jgi:hypothetical protein